MSSALKPVITPGGPQAAPVSAQINKPVHAQSAATYGQTSTHMPQNLVNLTHNAQSTPHIQPNHSNSTNHYSLNVPNASQHFTSGNQSSFPLSTNHPMPNVTQSLPASTFTNMSKTPALPPQSYQPNLGQPPNVPVTQSLPATNLSTVAEQDKPQSNGTPELTNAANEIQQNHISSQKEKTQVQTTQSVESDKEEKIDTPASTPSLLTSTEQNHADEHKQESTPALPAVESTPIESKSEPTTPATADSSTDNELKDNESNKPEKMDDDTEEASTTTPTANTPTKKEQNIVTTPKSSTKSSLRASRKPKAVPKADEPTKKTEKVTNQKSPSSAGKSKRTRVPTQPYQCPLPEIEIIRKITTSSPRNRNNDDKLIIFYKNEFLAVRNSEGGFYVCQTMQNIYKSSPKIRIRWLSQDKNDKSGEIYKPDFYDQTDFDCILTNLELERVDKGKYRLPAKEQIRTDSILKRALAVEKGDATPPSLTEEHPDGLDLSLYKEESQLKKRKGQKRKSSPSKKSSKGISTKKSPQQAKVMKVASRPTTSRTATPVATTSKKPTEPKKSTTNSSAGRSERAKRRSDNSSTKSSPVVDHKKAKVLAKIGRKTAVVASKVQPSKAPVKVSKPQKAVASTSQAATRKTKRTRK